MSILSAITAPVRAARYVDYKVRPITIPLFVVFFLFGAVGFIANAQFTDQTDFDAFMGSPETYCYSAEQQEAAFSNYSTTDFFNMVVTLSKEYINTQYKLITSKISGDSNGIGYRGLAFTVLELFFTIFFIYILIYSKISMAKIIKTIIIVGVFVYLIDIFTLPSKLSDYIIDTGANYSVNIAGEILENTSSITVNGVDLRDDLKSEVVAGNPALAGYNNRTSTTASVGDRLFDALDQSVLLVVGYKNLIWNNMGIGSILGGKALIAFAVLAVTCLLYFSIYCTFLMCCAKSFIVVVVAGFFLPIMPFFFLFDRTRGIFFRYIFSFIEVWMTLIVMSLCLSFGLLGMNYFWIQAINSFDIDVLIDGCWIYLMLWMLAIFGSMRGGSQITGIIFRSGLSNSAISSTMGALGGFGMMAGRYLGFSAARSATRAVSGGVGSAARGAGRMAATGAGAAAGAAAGTRAAGTAAGHHSAPRSWMRGSRSSSSPSASSSSSTPSGSGGTSGTNNQGGA